MLRNAGAEPAAEALAALPEAPAQDPSLAAVEIGDAANPREKIALRRRKL
jgi:hypothetical protein